MSAMATTTAFADEAQRVRTIGHLSDEMIASATGAAASTVRDWLSGRSAPTGTRAQRLAELASLVDRLVRVMRPEYVPVWLSKPVPALEDDKPIERIGRGDYRRVAKLIGELEYPGAS